MSVYTNEYTQVVVMTKSQVSQALTEQNAIIQHGIKVPFRYHFIHTFSEVTFRMPNCSMTSRTVTPVHFFHLNGFHHNFYCS